MAIRPSPKRIRQVLIYCKETGEFRWRINSGSHGRIPAGSVAGHVAQSGYVLIGIDGELYRAHMLAWVIVKGRWPSKHLDHRNLNRADNAWSNLRLATPLQNNANSPIRSHNKCGVKGVRFDPQKGRWRARIRVNKKEIHLGRFDSKEAAGAAYRAAATLHFGEYARFQ